MGEWTSFGGIASQFNHISIVLHLATTESIATASIYDSLLSAHLGALALPRAELYTGIPDFATEFDSPPFDGTAPLQASRRRPSG